MKECLIILGAGVMQSPAIQIAKELGFYTIALDGSAQAPCVSMADRFEQIDLKDKEGIETFARSLLGACGSLGIMTAGTDFSASVAWTAERLGLPGIPYEAALNASDKSRMRECFKKASLPSPEFTTITAEDLKFYHRVTQSDAGDSKTALYTPGSRRQEESSSMKHSSQTTHDTLCNSVVNNSSSLSFPIVIKPVDNMGSRGCRRVDSIEEFEQAARTAIGFSRSGRAIVEAFMDGPEFSVDAVVHHGEITISGLADRHIYFPPYFIEMGHTMPTVIETEKQNAILETFRAGIRALGLAGEKSSGAAKGDIKLTENGPMIGEIAARLSGGYMSGWTYPYSSGVKPIRAAILAAMGKEPDNLAPIKNWTCAERAFISIPGTVKTITGIEEAKSEPHVKDFFLRIAEGGKVSFPENNVSKCGNILAAAPGREEAIASAEASARAVLIRLDPASPATSDFLSKAGSPFPPDAFQLTDSLKAAVTQIPEFQPVTGESLSICSIYPFPAFTNSCVKDYMGRTIDETLNAVRSLTGFPLPIAPKNAENKVLGCSFWSALIRGSYQGAVYYIDNLGLK